MGVSFIDIPCLNTECQKNDTKMQGGGASFGGRVQSSNHKCPACGLHQNNTLMPDYSKYQYSIKATTAEERKEEEIKKIREANELELAKKITAVEERYK